MNAETLYEVFTNHQTLTLGNQVEFSFWNSQRRDAHNGLVESWWHGILSVDGVTCFTLEDDVYPTKNELINAAKSYLSSF